MSITITCEFENKHQAQRAAERLRRRGYIVSGETKKKVPAYDPLLIAYPYGAPGGNSGGNNLMAALPPLAGNACLLHVPEQPEKHLVSVLTDDTQAPEAKQLLTALGGRML